MRRRRRRRSELAAILRVRFFCELGCTLRTLAVFVIADKAQSDEDEREDSAADEHANDPRLKAAV